ncbi:MAG: glycosyltransferase family protein, partial [Rhodothermia bacterium]
LGLGHMRRNLLIAGAISQARPGVQTLLITGTGYANAFRIPDRVDILSLPSLWKVANGCYAPKRLHIDADELSAFRTATMTAAIQSFRPDLFIVDKVPRGVRRELDPILAFLKEKTSARVVLGLRDILDDPCRVRDEWEKESNTDAVRDFYDAVWIYGDPNVYNAVDEYSWSADIRQKISFTGYLDRTKEPANPGVEVAELLDSLCLETGFNLCVVGGGSDGFRVAEGVAKSGPSDRGTLILAGPFMPQEQIDRLKALSGNRSDTFVTRFSNEPLELYRRAGRVISMGGYNTMLELVGLGKRPLIVPRVRPRTEQLIRATRFRELGLVDVLHPDELSVDNLTSWLNSSPVRSTGIRKRLDLGGLDKIADSITSLTGPNHDLNRNGRPSYAAA